AAIKRDDEREADRNFRRGDGDDEKHQHLAVEFVVEARKRDEREVRGVEHQLQRHVNDDEIAAHDDAEQSQREQQEADGQIMFESNVHFYFLMATKERKSRKRNFSLLCSLCFFAAIHLI